MRDSDVPTVEGFLLKGLHRSPCGTLGAVDVVLERFVYEGLHEYDPVLTLEWYRSVIVEDGGFKLGHIWHDWLFPKGFNRQAGPTENPGAPNNGGAVNGGLFSSSPSVI